MIIHYIVVYVVGVSLIFHVLLYVPMCIFLRIDILPLLISIPCIFDIQYLYSSHKIPFFFCLWFLCSFLCILFFSLVFHLCSFLFFLFLCLCFPRAILCVLPSILAFNVASSLISSPSLFLSSSTFSHGKFSISSI